MSEHAKDGQTNDSEVSRRLASAVEYARTGGEKTLPLFGVGRVGVETKGDGTPVTEADRACETEIREAIARDYPRDGVLGEEFGAEAADGASGFRWIIDPIDGTFSFVHGVPLYTTLIGVERIEDGRPSGVVAGVVHAPALGETVYGALGHGAWHVARPGAEPSPARVSTRATLAEATVATTSADYWDESLAPVWERVERAAGHTRGWPDAYAAILVATGRCDAIVEPRLKAWDVAPFFPILREAGGRASGWRGEDSPHAGDIVVTNGLLHADVLALLGG